MRKLLLISAMLLATLSSAKALGVNCGSFVIQKGSICQYITSTGSFRVCIVTDSSDGGKTYNLVIVNAARSWTSVTNVPNDQSQLTQNSFAVISCQVPF